MLDRGVVAWIGVVAGLALITTPCRGQCTFEEKLELVPSDGAAGDGFGAPMCASGDVLVVGVPFADGLESNSGAAYVYRNHAGTWIEEQKLTSGDPGAFDDFGISVAVEGDVLAVGAFYDDVTLPDQGSVSVYRFDGAVWNLQHRLTASDPESEARFGRSVAIAGDWMAVGAYRTDDAGVDSGSVYLFRNDGTAWVERQKVIASDAASGDLFGVDVSLSGNALLVGSSFDDTTFTGTGSGYVYRFDGGAWVEEQRLTASDAAQDDFLGAVVALDGDTAVLGAYGDDASGPDSGAVYVFRFDGTSWVEVQQLVASDVAPGDEFGWSVDLGGDVLAVGAYWDDDLGHDAGSAYVFRRTGGNWIQERKLLPSDGASHDWFGMAVAVQGQDLWIGAFQHDAIGGDSGAAYLYDIRKLVLSATPTIVTPGASIQFQIAPGQPGSPTALFAVAVSGVPVFIHVLTAAFGQDCTVQFSATAPPAVTGLSVGIRAYALGVGGGLTASDPVTLTIQ